MKKILARAILVVIITMAICDIFVLTLIIPIDCYMEFNDPSLLLVPIAVYIILPLVIWSASECQDIL
jgi:hypothetical protein